MATSCPRCTSSTHELLLLLSPLPVSPPHAAQSPGVVSASPTHSADGTQTREGFLEAGTPRRHFQVEGACGHGQRCLVPSGSSSVLGLLLQPLRSSSRT